ncbi:MAG: hypothetical protein RLZZ584_2572 [Pseudomonadota bacterium]|jgi:mono/diheme cytochrome c family protein
MSAALLAGAVLVVGLGAVRPARAATPAQMSAAYAAQAGGQAASAERGQKFFTSRHGREWSCATCHGELPVKAGKHASTGKSIAPLAPAYNPDRFTDEAKVEKWFRRNCNDVVGRECTPAEKADVIAWLLTVK